MNNVLLIDFGSTYTKITAVDIEQEQVLGTARGITTVETDIMDGLNQALSVLFAQTGKLEFKKVLGCSSAAGGLKMIAIGLVPEMTAEAAKRAALGAGAKVLKVFSHELSEYEIEEIAELKPDIILLAGGTDGGNQKVIVHNAKMLAGLGMDVPVVVAGNKSVAPTIVN
ncbi:MAG: glutamate mutase L, partial [Sporomusa sp.]